MKHLEELNTVLCQFRFFFHCLFQDHDEHIGTLMNDSCLHSLMMAFNDSNCILEAIVLLQKELRTHQTTP